jgi:hypothetical protein
MDHGMQVTLIRQLFSEARAKAKTAAELVDVIDWQGRLKVASTGAPAKFSQIDAVRTRFRQVVADGVVTDQEIQALIAFLTKQDLVLGLPAPVDVSVDLNAIELPPLL